MCRHIVAVLPAAIVERARCPRTGHSWAGRDARGPLPAADLPRSVPYTRYGIVCGP